MDLNATDPTAKSTERCGDSLYQGFSKSLPYFDQYRDHDCLLWLLITFIRNKPKKLKRACHGLADREFLLHVYLILKNVCFYGVEKVMWFIAREKKWGPHTNGFISVFLFSASSEANILVENIIWLFTLILSTCNWIKCQNHTQL